MRPTNYFRFPTEEAWNEAALTLGVASMRSVLVTEATYDEETGEELTPAVYEDQTIWSYYTHEHACDVVGTVYNDDAVFDAEGEMISAPTAKDGWHVNIRMKSHDTLPENLNTYIVEPQTPSRVFA